MRISHEPCATRNDCYHSRAVRNQPREAKVRGGRNQPREAKVRAGRIGGRISGRKNVESGQAAEALRKAHAVLAANPEIMRENGRNVGRIFGHIFGQINGRIAGRKAVESGQLVIALRKAHAVLAANPEIMRENGRNAGRKNVESGHLKRISRGVLSTADGILFRSQTEALFYCVVKELGSEPTYEPDTIRLADGTSYTPDFILGKSVLNIPANVPIELKPSRNTFNNRNTGKAIRAGATIVYWDELVED